VRAQIAKSELNKHTTTANLQLPYSEKGNRNAKKQNTRKETTSIFQTDQSGKIRIQILSKGNKYSHPALKNIGKTAISIPDHKLPKLFKANNLPVSTKNAKQTQKIKNSLKLWIDKFRGVATKYLHHYWTWFEQMTEFALAQNQHKQLLQYCIAIQTPQTYQQQ